MAAQVRAAVINGEPQPFKAIAEVSKYLEPCGDLNPLGDYVEMFEDGSLLFSDWLVWNPEVIQTHENWPLMKDIIEAWQYAKEDAEMRSLECPYDEA